MVETGAGAAARIADADYAAAGATIAPDARTALDGADIVLKVRGPEARETALMKKGAVLAALLAPHTEKDAIAGLAGQGVTAFAMEFLPRISRAQAMDVLSSPGQSRRLQGGDRRRRHIRPRHADDDDGGGHHRAGARAGDGRGRGGPSGHRHRQAAGRHCQRHRCAPRHQGTGGIAWAALSSR